MVAALINLIAIAVYHDNQAKWLNGTAAGLCLVIAFLAYWRRHRQHARRERA